MFNVTIDSTAKNDHDDLDVITVEVSRYDLSQYSSELLEELAMVELRRFYGNSVENYRLERVQGGSDWLTWQAAEFIVIEK